MNHHLHPLVLLAPMLHRHRLPVLPESALPRCFRLQLEEPPERALPLAGMAHRASVASFSLSARAQAYRVSPVDP
jgi:hypothetical protein